jgi:hypothetical protein
MASASKLEISIDPRQPGRHAVMLAATVRQADDQRAEVTVTDLSPYGLHLSPSAGLVIGAVIRIDLPVASARARVAWIDGADAGCIFLDPLATELVRLIADIWDAGPGLRIC